MAELVFILTPLLVLPFVLLFRFVGCAQIAGLKDPSPAPAQDPPEPIPNYRDYIMGLPVQGDAGPAVTRNPTDIVSYWRLVDTVATPDVATDEKGLWEGEYRTTADPDMIPGDFIPGQDSLIVSDAKASCRFFNGGYVVIPTKKTAVTTEFFTEEFTLEAWLVPNFGMGTEHTLFQAGGHYVRQFESNADYHGFRIYATAGRAWQVGLGSNGVFLDSPPLIPPGASRTHLAVIVQTVGSSTRRVTVVIDGKAQPASQERNLYYSLPIGAPFIIGAAGQESDPRQIPAKPQPNMGTPIRASIQEVVLYRRALSMQEIKNHIFINRRES
jgi:hypothetical protein